MTNEELELLNAARKGAGLAPLTKREAEEQARKQKGEKAEPCDDDDTDLPPLPPPATK